jgi:DNA primase
MYTYQKFDIVEVAERCGISLDSRTLSRSEVEAWCPFCPTKSSDYHMYLNRAKEQFVCYKCSAKGNSVSLCAQALGISNKEAFVRLTDECGNYSPQEQSNPKPDTVPGYEIAPLNRRHSVYYNMLKAMVLTESHLWGLADRGLSAERIRRNMYRSMPKSGYERRRIAEQLAQRHDLRGVPGFYYSKHGNWELCGKPGILIPICDADGYIQGLQIRLDGVEKKKYRWLSSNPDYNYPYGTSASTWVHVTGNRDSNEAFITEGGLKGDVASYLSGDLLFVCTAGVASIKHLTDTLRSLNISKVYGCYDMDQLVELRGLEQRRRNNPFDNDAAKPRALEKMEAAVESLGLQYERCEWEPVLNGIDDYYLNSLVQLKAS